MQNAQNLIWIDLEMTGLDPDNDVIIEMATIVTDSDLNVLAEGPTIAVHQSDEILAGILRRGRQGSHGQSGSCQQACGQKTAAAVRYGKKSGHALLLVDVLCFDTKGRTLHPCRGLCSIQTGRANSNQ